MSIQAFNTLIKEFCKTIALEDYFANDDGYYSFLLDDDLIYDVQYEVDSNMVSFFMQLGEIKSSNRTKIIEDILDANVLWRGTGGGTLGLDSASGIATFAYQENILHMDSARFETLFALLVTNARIWKSRISAEPEGRISAEPEGRTSGIGNEPPSGAIIV